MYSPVLPSPGTSVSQSHSRCENHRDIPVIHEPGVVVCPLMIRIFELDLAKRQ